MKSKMKKHKYSNINLDNECEYIEYILSSDFDDNSKKLLYYINDKKNLKIIIEGVNKDYNKVKDSQELREIESKNYSLLYRRNVNEYSFKTTIKELYQSFRHKYFELKV